MAGTRITWDDGGEAALGAVDALHMTALASTRAFPPGAPVRGVLHAEAPVRFELKVAGSKREGDGYVVRGRLVNATTAVRAAFATG